MKPTTRTGLIARLFALALALALVAGACGDSGSDDDDNAQTNNRGEESDDTGASDDSTDSAAPANGNETFNEDLPVGTRYGYTEWELTSVERTDAASDDWYVSDKEDEEDWAVFRVDLTNLTEDVEFTVPNAVARLEVDDKEYDQENTLDTPLGPGDTESAELVYAVPDGTDLAEATIIIQEGADDPEDRRIPAYLNVNGEEAPPGETVDLEFDPATLTHETYCAGQGLITVNRVYLSPDLGFTPAGNALVEEGLGRAPEDSLLLTVEADTRLVEDGSLGVGGCLTELSPGAPTVAGSDGTPIEPVVLEAASDAWNPEPVDLIYAFPVPAGEDAYEVSYRDGYPGDTIAVTLHASR